jgi:hypothetical protein
MRGPQEQKRRVDAFVIIRDAMRDKSMVALGRVVLSKRERVPILQPWGERASSGRRCATHTRSGPTRTISTTSRTSRTPKTCWRSPSISWKTL